MARERQIEFHPEQLPHPRIVPVCFAVSIGCIVIVVILLLAGVDGPFIGPWG
jgi:hypothetical protein